MVCRIWIQRLTGCSALMLALACSRTQPFDSWGEGQSLSNEPFRECTENGHCDDQSICIDEQCVFFGQCLGDWHCLGRQVCINNECVGDLPGAAPTPETPAGICEINADCAKDHLCVLGECYKGIECIEHSHCPVATACVRADCVSALAPEIE